MVNKRWLRVISLVLASVCLISIMTAAAAEVTVKKTIWDLQTAVNEGNTASYADILKDILGNPDELHTNASGEYEIWSELGLYNMARNATKGYTFKLMKSIDMGGKNWTPIASFKGKFIGGADLTISNFTITQASGTNMGFFGNIQNIEGASQSEVTELHLKNVKIIVDGDDTDNENTNSGVRYVGAIAGTNSGILTNCSSKVIVTDMRQLGDLEKKTYYGTLVGLNTEHEEGSNKVPTGMIYGTNGLNTQINVAADSAFTQDVISSDYTDAKTVNSKMALFLSDKVDYATKTAKTAVGIAGFTNDNGIDHDLRWQDITNSTDLAAQPLQSRRETAAARMYEMCTVEWQPAQTMYNYNNYSAGNGWGIEITVKAAGSSGSTINKGIQKGLPYAHSTNNLERFNDLVGHYTGALEQWDTKAYFYNTNASIADNGRVMNDQTEWGMYIGSDCSGQVSSAWRVISAVDKNTSGWVRVVGTADIYPSQKYMGWYNIKPVNGLIFEDPGDLNGDGNDNSVDKAIYVANYYNNNRTHYLDALAMTSKADVLVGYSDRGNGHAIMAISDAVVIREYDGDVDAELSYIVTAEQGGSGTDSDGINRYSETTVNGDIKTIEWSSTCCVDRRTTFADLVRDGEGTGKTSWRFFPVTCDVLRNADSAAANVAITMDAAGQINSTFHIINTTVNGETFYVGLGEDLKTYRSSKSTLSLSDVYDTIETGATVTVQLANGQKYTGTFGTEGLTLVK